MMKFVQETYDLVLATFVHISNISAFSDLILTKPQSQLSVKVTFVQAVTLPVWTKKVIFLRHMSG